jgi:hypothetical protein
MGSQRTPRDLFVGRWASGDRWRARGRGGSPSPWKGFSLRCRGVSTCRRFDGLGFLRSRQCWCVRRTHYSSIQMRELVDHERGFCGHAHSGTAQ